MKGGGHWGHCKPDCPIQEFLEVPDETCTTASGRDGICKVRTDIFFFFEESNDL